MTQISLSDLSIPRSCKQLNKFAVTSILAFYLSLSAGNAQVGLTVGAALNGLQDGIFSNIDESVNNAFNRFDTSVSKLRSQAEGLLDSARNDLNSILDKAVEELNEQEREIFRYYDSALRKLDAQVADYLRQGNVTLLNAGNLASKFPFVDDDATIFWIEVNPPLYIHSAPERRITAFGLNLDKAENSLLVNGVAARNALTTPTELSFIADNADFSSGAKLEYTLREDGFWSFLSSWFDHERPIPPIEYEAVPDNLGDIRLVYNVESFPVIQRAWPTEGIVKVSCRNSRNPLSDNNCQTGYPRNVVQATAGYRILPDSIQIVDRSASGCRGHTVVFGLEGVSGNSFTVFGGATANSGAGRVCEMVARYVWSEVKENPDQVETFSEPQAFFRSKRGVSLPMPTTGATAIAVEFKPVGTDVFERIGIPSPRWPFQFGAQTGTGVVEVVW
jgi:hypothetical protein